MKNRDKLKESESFVITLQKDKLIGETTKKRINVRKIMSLEEVINKPYSKVTIELKENFDIHEIKDILSENGDTEVQLVIRNKNKIAHYLLQNNRKFDLDHLNAFNAKDYVEKITV